MHSSLLLPSISLFSSVALAGQHQFPLPIQANSCSIAESTNNQSSTVPQIPEVPHSHSLNGNHSHDIDLDDLFGFDDVPDESNAWTREPECIIDQTTQKQYCVYTNSSFANNRGISLFASPQTASAILALPAFTIPSLSSHINNSTSAPYKTISIPGRGNGLFATRKLERGDLIVADTPVGIYQSDAFVQDYEDGYKFLRKSFEWLPEETRELFMRMAAHNEGDKVMERINTNSFAGEFAGEDCFLIYPETALLNHDCRPNAMYYHNPKTLVHSTYASRTINPGEEITITYINLLQPHEDRSSTLQQIWGFTCTCSLCTSSSITRQASEARIHQMNQLQTILSDWSHNSPATPQMAEKLINLYSKENLHAAKGTGHMFAALAYNAIGDVGEAKKHAEKAIDAGIMGSGDMERDEGELKAIVEMPKKHWSYNVRNQARGGW